jgi:hypothetical protein
LRSDGDGADAFCDGELGEDCVHCVFDELLAGHALGRGDVDDVKVGVEEEYRVGEGVDDVCVLDMLVVGVPGSFIPFSGLHSYHRLAKLSRMRSSCCDSPFSKSRADNRL